MRVCTFLDNSRSFVLWFIVPLDHIRVQGGMSAVFPSPIDPRSPLKWLRRPLKGRWCPLKWCFPPLPLGCSYRRTHDRIWRPPDILFCPKVALPGPNGALNVYSSPNRRFLTRLWCLSRIKQHYVPLNVLPIDSLAQQEFPESRCRILWHWFGWERGSDLSLTNDSSASQKSTAHNIAVLGLFVSFLILFWHNFPKLKLKASQAKSQS